MENKFTLLGIDKRLVLGLKKQNITNPTEIQTLLYEPLVRGSDIIARSQTGTGKTLAYLLPIIGKIDFELRSTQVLILAPTHELAVQINNQIKLLAVNSGMDIRSMLAIGNVNIDRQTDNMKLKPQIVVGSAGRILDLIQKRKLPAHTVRTIILDEADRLLDKQNIENVKAVIKTTLKDRQIIMLSASIKKESREEAKLILKEGYEIIEARGGNMIPENIRHVYIKCHWRDKIKNIRKIYYGLKPGKTIIFVNNPDEIETLVDRLNYHRIKCGGIYGKADKMQRQKALESFRQGKTDVLISSDIGARGLDIPEVTLIINVDIPEDHIQYLHRAGRTGRGDGEGMVISLVTDKEVLNIKNYERKLKIKILPKEMNYGDLSDIQPGSLKKRH